MRVPYNPIKTSPEFHTKDFETFIKLVLDGLTRLYNPHVNIDTHLCDVANTHCLASLERDSLLGATIFRLFQALHKTRMAQ